MLNQKGEFGLYLQLFCSQLCSDSSNTHPARWFRGECNRKRSFLLGSGPFSLNGSVEEGVFESQRWRRDGAGGEGRSWGQQVQEEGNEVFIFVAED